MPATEEIELQAFQLGVQPIATVLSAKAYCLFNIFISHYVRLPVAADTESLPKKFLRVFVPTFLYCFLKIYKYFSRVGIELSLSYCVKDTTDHTVSRYKSAFLSNKCDFQFALPYAVVYFMSVAVKINKRFSNTVTVNLNSARDEISVSVMRHL